MPQVSLRGIHGLSDEGDEVKLWPKRKKIEPEVGHIEGPVLAGEAPCILCGGTEYEPKGQRKGRCMTCGFPRSPVLIKANVKQRVGNKNVTRLETVMVAEEALGEMRRTG